MKFTSFRNGKMYKRLSDGVSFKKDADKHFKVADGKWQLTEDLSLGDDFEIINEDPAVVSLEDTFYAYRNGTAESRGKYLDRLLLGLAKAADSLKSQSKKIEELEKKLEKSCKKKTSQKQISSTK